MKIDGRKNKLLGKIDFYFSDPKFIGNNKELTFYEIQIYYPVKQL